MKNHTIKYRQLHTFAAAIVLSLFTICANGQNNRLKIDDELYSLYQQSKKKLSSEDCLPIINEMLQKSIAKGDKKARCMALSNKMLYYYGTTDEKNFNLSAEELKKNAKETNQSAYYYFAYQYQVLRLSNSGRSAEALKLAEQMQQESQKDGSPYGISTSYKAMADIYYGRSDYENAKIYYKKGLEFSKANTKTSDLTVYYAMLAMIARRQEKYDESLNYAEEGLKHSKSEIATVRLQLTKTYSLLLLERYTEFLEQLKVLDKNFNLLGNVEKDTYYSMKINACLLNKEYDKALQWAEKCSNELNKIEQQIKVYEAMGEWEKAYNYHQKYIKIKTEALEQLHSKDLAEANAKFKNERLESEKLRLEIANANGKLQAAKSLAKQKATEVENAKLENYNKELKLHNSDLTLAQFKAENSLKKSELERQQAKLAKQRAEAEKESQKHHFLLWLLVGGIAAMSFIVITLVRSWQNSKRFIRTLKQKNNELAIERDRAQQSEKMKTMFIQNISHEIRTPLNTIVGFSDLMLTPELELDNEEKKNFKNIIHQNSDLLTGLVNDVLTLSELQSGKAKLNITDCHCNSICRSALDTVLHRKPQDVELNFTTDIDDDFTIKSDSRRISQVLINFLTNAEKYTTEGSITLDCSAKKNPNYITFSVTDTGCGIPEDKQQQIFGRFEKLDDFHQGIGLGLNICNLIASLLDAKIGIDSTYRQGSRFYFAVKC